MSKKNDQLWIVAMREEPEESVFEFDGVERTRDEWLSFFENASEEERTIFHLKRFADNLQITLRAGLIDLESAMPIQYTPPGWGEPDDGYGWIGRTPKGRR